MAAYPVFLRAYRVFSVAYRVFLVAYRMFLVAYAGFFTGYAGFCATRRGFLMTDGGAGPGRWAVAARGGTFWDAFLPKYHFAACGPGWKISGAVGQTGAVGAACRYFRYI